MLLKFIFKKATQKIIEHLLQQAVNKYGGCTNE